MTRGASPATKRRTRRVDEHQNKASARQEPSPVWRRVDLHVHTPASSDYQEPQVSFLDILRRAETRELDAIAFTDHNSVRGYADLWREIEDLELLEFLKRLEPEEAARLQEYRRILGKVLLLPGFEFTATFGFHILAIFPERTSVRLMEHLLLLLGVAEDRFGSGEVGATTDVLRAYEILADHGALVIGAHVNSTHGIAMQGLRFGGQTKIAYTQDPHLHALEVTDLMVGGHRRSTARFFNGTKPEYPRRMHCIQGSDAHRLDRDPRRDTNLGVGDRVTEILLPTVSFEAVKQVFLGDDFGRTRPYVPFVEPADPFKAARAAGHTAVQAFHESLSTKRTGYAHVLRDVVAFANTDGGVVYVGASPSERRPIAGVADAPAATDAIRGEIGRQVMPAPRVAIESLESDGKTVLAIRVPRGTDRPYALAPGGIFVRQDGESVVADRDQIVAMVRGIAGTPSTAVPSAAAEATVGPNGAGRRGRRGRDGGLTTTEVVARTPAPLPDTPRRGRRGTATSPAEHVTAASVARLEEMPGGTMPDDVSPRTGVEIVDAYDQDDVNYYTMRDLRNSELTHNVTRDTGRRLWRSAIQLREDRPIDDSDLTWHGDYGFWRSYKPRGGDQRFHLAYRGDGDVRMFYGVSEEGMDELWRSVIPGRRDSAPPPPPTVAPEPDEEPTATPISEAAPTVALPPEPEPEPKPARPRRTRTRTTRATKVAPVESAV